MPGSRPGPRGLLLIAVFKLAKGFLLLAAALGALKLLHHDVAGIARHWINALRVDPDNFFLHRLLARLSIIDDHKLKELSVGTFIYSALSFIEGIGLALRKRWAEYFTTIVTAALLPIEIWEIYHHATTAKIIVLLINLAVVAYLIWELRRNHSGKT